MDTIKYVLLKPEYDAALARIIRQNLRTHKLDIPGTVYFDEGLDHLSSFYDSDGREYYVLLKEDEVIGGIGYAKFPGFDECCELQKLYLTDASKGNGTGYGMISFIEDRAREAGYKRIYLETHTNLQAAIHIYERSGYREINRPESVVHGSMNRFYLKDIR